MPPLPGQTGSLTQEALSPIGNRGRIIRHVRADPAKIRELPVH